MRRSKGLFGAGMLLSIAILILTIVSTVVLRSIAWQIYPTYFIYLILAFFIYVLVLRTDFDIFLLFSRHLYYLSLLLLLLPLIVGQVTRGAIRWIPIGSLTIQPSEIVRPFLLLFFAKEITDAGADLRKIGKGVIYFIVPFLLILIQPSLGVAVLTTLGFVGILIASSINKRYFLIVTLSLVLLLPVSWVIMAPYQKTRIISFLNPNEDPLGAGYNSIQSMISVGSGMLYGRGLGEGVQTQLKFLPEKHSDFIFAAVSEEMGFLGAGLVLLGLFVLFWCLIYLAENASSPTARAYIAGVFLVLLAETVIHVGMNLGLLPITGVPLPFVSAGGSSLLGTTVAVALAIKAKKKS
jgi:rod shape determining protein RodA